MMPLEAEMDEETKAKLLDAGEKVRKLRAEFDRAYDEATVLTRVAQASRDRSHSLMIDVGAAEVELAAIARGPESRTPRAG